MDTLKNSSVAGGGGGDGGVGRATKEMTSAKRLKSLFNMSIARQLSGRWLIVFVVLIVIVVGTLVGILSWKLSDDDNDDNDDVDVICSGAPYEASFGRTLHIRVEREKTQLTIRSKAGEVTNVAEMGMNISEPGNVRDCHDTTRDDDICYEWPGDRTLHISRHHHHQHPASHDVTNDDVVCYDVTWRAQTCVTQVLQDCYSLREAHWYGGFEDYNQFWPLNDVQQNMAPYVTGDAWAKQYGDVLERFFVSSNGFGVYVHPEVPLHLSFNQSGDGLLCLAAKYDRRGYPYHNPSNSLPVLRYQICQGSDVRDLHSHMTALHVPRPRDIPAEYLFRGAIWSTWAMYKGPVNQSLVLEFANKILDSGLPYSQLEIDDDWTPKYGDMDFNQEKFPDAKGLITQLTQMGFRVSVWMHPFMNLDSQAAEHAIRNGYVVKAVDSDLPALVSWWRGKRTVHLDVTNSEAVDWFLNGTRRLRDVYNVTSFKYDAGEANWLPKVYSTHLPLESPDEFSRLYVEMAFRSDEQVRGQEVRVGTRTQDKPIMVRMLDRQSAWGYHRAIRTVIPCALTLGLIGYPFVLPDMIGGNGVDEVHIDSTEYPDAELYVRWLQVNTFLPFLQFSVGPWVYNSTVQSICRNFTALRSRYADAFIALAREAARTGAPIVRPLWWIAPTDQEALVIDSQFLLGDDLLVAPVVERGSRSRDVYLPAGTWRDQTRGGTYQGPRWLSGYSADLDVLPHFQRV
ncbi:myogenesis-regulating glycosidase-like [Babylonia areolata]|uniref:myogenesis-regulating glycosidase-like n=1 Tax=Babylonia areolata TaxID=304850 RepID=UPI003FD4245D